MEPLAGPAITGPREFIPPRNPRSTPDENLNILTATALAAGMASTPALAQQGPVAVVNIGNIQALNDILDVDVSENEVAIPVGVQVGIGVAAQVCGVEVAVLSQQIRDGNNVACTIQDAANVTQGFRQAVNRQVTAS